MASDNNKSQEEIVCVDLSGLIDCNWSNFIGKKAKFIGLDSDEVVMQLGKHIFRGSYKESLGTRVFIDEDENNPENVVTTFKLLNMHKIFVQEKSSDTNEAADSTEQASTNMPPIQEEKDTGKS